MNQFKMKKRGFTLMEVLVATAIFIIVATAFFSAFTSLFRLANGNQARTLATQLAAEQFEIIRNIPYADIGLTNGIPLGVLPQDQILTRGGIHFNVRLTIRNINLSTSTVQASNKLVEVNVTCPKCQNFQPVYLTGQISPANLQSADKGGALVVQVFNGNGEPVQDATVNVQSVATTSVTNTDVTNNRGILNIIGVPPGVNMYKIIVTKDGYSTEETFPIGEAGNPNPTKPNVTILDQQVSQISFAIDKLSSLKFSSVTPLCVPVPDFNFSLKGAKNIGDNLPKYSEDLSTDSSGILNLNNIEWDTYTVIPSDANYHVAGINPDSPFSLNPDISQEVQFVLAPKDQNSVMISVVDSSTGLPLSGAEVTLSGVGYNEMKVTGQGYLRQIDWTGGSGQDFYLNESQYFVDNGVVDTATSSGDIVLRDFFGQYDINATGTLESSIFDTGTTSNYYSLYWTPNNQSILTGVNSLKIQFASNSSSTMPWVYRGPDGLENSYYTSPGESINIIHNNDRYVRYKTFLTTETATVTPKLSEIFFAYTSGCIPPGQVIFQGLTNTTYTVSVSMAGYGTVSQEIQISDEWQKVSIPLTVL